ncbi:MAG TPA: hypothetical protein VK572_16730 [Burkholderiales bacterium]|nr:hypothetical protein [Burkholderiales bacterium]
MSTLSSPLAIERQEGLAALRSLWELVVDDLHRRRLLLAEEIRSYPTPIPRCDTQFNHLYEQQARLARELDRVGAFAEKKLGREDYIELIGRFVASVPYTDDAAEPQLRSRLEAELSALEK